MERLRELGFRYILLDEVTLIRDFIDSAALLSDIYTAQGMKIDLSGTNSLGFWFALHRELYDRAKVIHTTFIPYREHSRLSKIDQIDEYIRYGGTLRAGESAFDDAVANVEDASFRDNGAGNGARGAYPVHPARYALLPGPDACPLLN